MSVIENYKNRVERTSGLSLKEYVKDQVSSTLSSFLKDSQYGMDVKIDGVEKRIGIMTGGMTDTRDEVLVLSKPDVLNMGVLFEWENDFWVVVKREARVIKESFYGTAYRCNVDLKWVDDKGILISQKAYAKGRGLSSILVENKYTDPPVLAREVDTPITVITQRNPGLKQDMRFLFNGQPYRVTFVDNLSIDGTTVLGMYDDILQDGDDVENNVANYKNRYSIELGFEREIIVSTGEAFTATYSILDDGVIAEDKKVVFSVIKGKAKISESTITPLSPEDIVILAALEDNELVNTDFIIHSGTEWIEENVFIVGPDKIAWNKVATYKLNNSADAEFILDWSAAPKVKHTEEITDNTIMVKVGDKHSGEINLIAMTGELIITKKIEIVSVEVV